MAKKKASPAKGGAKGELEKRLKAMKQLGKDYDNVNASLTDRERKLLYAKSAAQDHRSAIKDLESERDRIGKSMAMLADGKWPDELLFEGGVATPAADAKVSEEKKDAKNKGNASAEKTEKQSEPSIRKLRTELNGAIKERIKAASIKYGRWVWSEVIAYLAGVKPEEANEKFLSVPIEELKDWSEKLFAIPEDQFAKICTEKPE